MILLFVLYGLKFTERAHMRERTRLLGKSIRNTVGEYNSTIINLIDNYINPLFITQTLVLIDMLAGFLEGLDSTQQLYRLTIEATVETQTDEIIIAEPNNNPCPCLEPEPEQNTGPELELEQNTGLEPEPEPENNKQEILDNISDSMLQSDTVNNLPVNINTEQKKSRHIYWDLSESDNTSKEPDDDAPNKFIETTDNEIKNLRIKTKPKQKSQTLIKVDGKKLQIGIKRD